MLASQSRPSSPSLRPDPQCPSELWDGVRCLLPAGHPGSHERPASEGVCALRWRASAAVEPPPPATELRRLEFFQLLRR